jgi:hypothetical protein
MYDNSISGEGRKSGGILNIATPESNYSNNDTVCYHDFSGLNMTYFRIDGIGGSVNMDSSLSSLIRNCVLQNLNHNFSNHKKTLTYYNGVNNCVLDYTDFNGALCYMFNKIKESNNNTIKCPSSFNFDNIDRINTYSMLYQSELSGISWKDIEPLLISGLLETTGDNFLYNTQLAEQSSDGAVSIKFTGDAVPNNTYPIGTECNLYYVNNWFVDVSKFKGMHVMGVTGYSNATNFPKHINCLKYLNNSPNGSTAYNNNFYGSSSTNLIIDNVDISETNVFTQFNNFNQKLILVNLLAHQIRYMLGYT